MTLQAQNHRIIAFWVVVITAIAIAVFCILTPPKGVISESALWLIAQFLIFAASLVGINLLLKATKRETIEEIKKYIESEVRENDK